MIALVFLLRATQGAYLLALDATGVRVGTFRRWVARASLFVPYGVLAWPRPPLLVFTVILVMIFTRNWTLARRRDAQDNADQALGRVASVNRRAGESENALASQTQTDLLSGITIGLLVVLPLTGDSIASWWQIVTSLVTLLLALVLDLVLECVRVRERHPLIAPRATPVALPA